MQLAAEKTVGVGATVAVEVATNELKRAIDAAANDDAEHRSATRQRSRDRDGADALGSAHGREDSGAMLGPAVEPLELAGRPRHGGAAGSAGIGHAPRSTTLRRLEDFVVGESNRLAFAASLQVADGASDAPGILFLHGDCGVGKTHLLQGIVRRRTQRAPRQVVRYVTAEHFTNEYIAAVRDGSLDQFRKRLRRVDLLAIDDIHFFANKSATQAEFLHTIDAIDLTGARVALVSDEHPRHIRKFSQSLVSRFLSGMVVRVERPDRDTRSQLVRRLARERGLDLTAAAEDLVAGRCAGSIREIEGAITRRVGRTRWTAWSDRPGFGRAAAWAGWRRDRNHNTDSTRQHRRGRLRPPTSFPRRSPWKRPARAHRGRPRNGRAPRPRNDHP